MIPGLGDDKIRMTDYRTKVKKQKQAGPSLKVEDSSFHHDCVLQGAHCLDNHNFWRPGLSKFERENANT